MRYAMIMAGGTGTRLWPMSRQSMPKQLVPFIDPEEAGGERRSLLQVAAGRLGGIVPADRRYICTNEGYRPQIRATMPEFGDDQILGEPVGRDTVNAVGFAAAVLQKIDPDAVFAVLTADQLIRPEERFRELMDLAYRLVEDDPTRLVTFSIKPTYPATGFGYVERGTGITGFDDRATFVERFVEKPSLEKAQAYVESGAFGWNSGMFVWKASTIMDCLRRYKPESHEGLMKIADAWGTEDYERVLGEVYPNLPKISVDYAIMEPASREQKRAAGTASEKSAVKVCTIEADLDWLDVGSWPSYGETLEPDADGNRVSGGAEMLRGRKNIVVNAEDGHTLALVGCEDMIVVHTKEATLIMPASKAQDLKQLHEQLPDEVR
ncbi:MAG: mannose-1-phosphate guanylyltransferase [Phycisphaerales bacterium JB050]